MSSKSVCDGTEILGKLSCKPARSESSRYSLEALQMRGFCDLDEGDIMNVLMHAVLRLVRFALIGLANACFAYARSRILC